MQKHILAFLCLPHQSILLGFPGHLRHGSNQDWMCNLWGPVSKLKYQHPCSKRSQNFRISRPYSKAAYQTRGPSQHGALGRYAGHMHISQALTLPPTDLICQESPQFCCSFPNPSCHLYYFFFHASFVPYLLCFPCPNHLLRPRWIPPHTLISLNSQDLVSDDLDGPFYKFSGFWTRRLTFLKVLWQPFVDEYGKADVRLTSGNFSVNLAPLLQIKNIEHIMSRTLKFHIMYRVKICWLKMTMNRWMFWYRIWSKKADYEIRLFSGPDKAADI